MNSRLFLTLLEHMITLILQWVSQVFRAGHQKTGPPFLLFYKTGRLECNRPCTLSPVPHTRRHRLPGTPHPRASGTGPGRGTWWSCITASTQEWLLQSLSYVCSRQQWAITNAPTVVPISNHHIAWRCNGYFYHWLSFPAKIFPGLDKIGFDLWERVWIWMTSISCGGRRNDWEWLLHATEDESRS